VAISSPRRWGTIGGGTVEERSIESMPHRGRRRLLAGLLALAIAPCRAAPHAVSRAAKPGAARALRVATLTERVLALHGQVGVGVLAPRARRGMGAALSDLAEAVRALGVAPPPSELHERTAILAILVEQFRPIALQAPGRDRARALAERADEIEWEARRIAALLEAADGAPREPAARAEEAAANAERIARLLLWRRWAIAASRDAARLEAAKAALREAMDALGGAVRPGAIGAEMQVAENQVAFLFAAAGRIEEGRAGERELEYAVKAAGNARESLERLAALFARGAP
jgi:hypothetical protein